VCVMDAVGLRPSRVGRRTRRQVSGQSAQSAPMPKPIGPIGSRDRRRNICLPPLQHWNFIPQTTQAPDVPARTAGAMLRAERKLAIAAATRVAAGTRVQAPTGGGGMMQACSRPPPGAGATSVSIASRPRLRPGLSAIGKRLRRVSVDRCRPGIAAPPFHGPAAVICGAGNPAAGSREQLAAMSSSKPVPRTFPIIHHGTCERAARRERCA